MIIDLKKIPILWASCNKPSLQARNAEMQHMLDILQLKATRVNGPVTDPYSLGVATGYIEMLTTYTPPFLAMEDDARIIITSKFSYELQPPKNAEAVYLGTSTYGRIRGMSLPQGSICAKYDEMYMRSFNMLGLHAVLYLSEAYIKSVVSLLEHWLRHPVGGCDDIVAENMHRHYIYCLREPWFYQKDEHSEAATLISIEPLI